MKKLMLKIRSLFVSKREQRQDAQLGRAEFLKKQKANSLVIGNIAGPFGNKEVK